MTSEVIVELGEIVGRSNVLHEEADLVIYARDKAMTPYSDWFKLRPEVVVLPSTSQEVQKIVQLANRRLIPITPRAGGCGFTGNAVPSSGGIVVDVKRMNKILEIDEENLLVTSQSGVQIQDLDTELRKKGLMYAD